MVTKTFYFLSNSSKYFKICTTTDFFSKTRVMFCLMKLQLYISSLTKRKMIDTIVMSLGCLCSLTLWHFVCTFYFKEIPDVPPNPKDFPEKTGWRKYISMKRDKWIQSNWKILNQLWDSMINLFPLICDHTTDLVFI